jgi:hypothetical protein
MQDELIDSERIKFILKSLTEKEGSAMKRLLLAGWVVMALFACFAGKTYAADSIITLDDNAGTSSFVVEDSDNVDQFKVNSDGQGHFAGHVSIGSASSDGRLEISSVGGALITANADGDGFDGGPRTISFGVVEEIVDGDQNLGFTVKDETAGGAYRLFINKSGNVGIGTTNPRNPLAIRASGLGEELISFENPNGVTKWHINQNRGGIRHGLNFVETGVADGRLFIKEGGNVGIGTTNPGAKLDVIGNVKIGSASSDGRLEISSVGSALITANSDGDGFDGGPRTISFGIVEEIVDGDQNLGFTVRDETAGGVYRLFINKNGNVGIGTTAPQHPLHMGSGAHVTAGGVWTNASSREYKENIRDLTVNEAVQALDGRLGQMNFAWTAFVQ